MADAEDDGPAGIGRGLTNYGDPDFAIYLRRSFARSMGYSNDMLEKKAANIAQSGAEVVLAGDMGCLMNMAGKLRRAGARTEVRHVAEVLAGMTDTPPIAGSKE